MKRSARFIFSVLIAGAALPALAATFDVPTRKAGQWKIEMVPETAGAVPAMTMQVCLDAASDKALMEAGLAMAGDKCQVLSSSKSGDQTIVDSACDMGAMKTKSHIVISGDFQATYSMQITSDIEGGPAKMPKHSVMTQNATWMGECNGLAPGEMLMPNGMKINALKAMNPGG